MTFRNWGRSLQFDDLRTNKASFKISEDETKKLFIFIIGQWRKLAEGLGVTRSHDLKGSDCLTVL